MAQVVVLDYSAAAAVNASVARANAPLRPDAQLQVSVQGAGVYLDRALLYRAGEAADGRRSPELPVPVRLEPDAPGATSWRIVSSSDEPLLRPDGDNRLAVRIAAPRPALPLPRTDFVEQQYHFTTVASPHATVPASLLEPRWSEPVSLAWSEPMSSVQATLQPAAPLKTRVDQSNPSKTWIQLGEDGGAGLADGQTYEVSNADARANEGTSLQRPVSFKVAVPPRARFVDAPTAPVTLRYGEAFRLKSSAELADARVTTTPDFAAWVTVTTGEIKLDLPEYRQGTEFDLNLLSATSTQGAPLAQPVRIHFATPPPLDPPTVLPEDDSIGIQPSAHPSVTFAEPVAHQMAATGGYTLIRQLQVTGNGYRPGGLSLCRTVSCRLLPT